MSYQQNPNQGQYPNSGQYGGTATSTGLSQNVAAGLSALFWIAAVIFLIIEKQNRFVRFYAMQTLIFGAAVLVVYIALSIVFSILAAIGLGFLSLLLYVLDLAILAGWILLIVKAFQGQYYKLPVLGDYAEKFADQMKI